MKKKKILIVTLTLLAVSVLAERIYHRQNRGFCVSKLISTQSSIDCLPPADVESLLDQSFRFIGAGGTSFVFLGEDEETILKLFKHHQLFFRHSLWNVVFPGVLDAWRIRKIILRENEHRHKRHFCFFNSCRLAFHELKEETGL